MLKYFRRNQKKLLAIFGVGLMIVFILPATFKSSRGGRDVLLGTLDGQKVHAADVTEARAEWDHLKRVYTRQKVESAIPGLAGGQQMLPVIYQLGTTLMDPFRGGLMNRVVADIEGHPEMYYLLQQEAQRMGAGASPEELDGMLREIRGADGTAPDLEDPEVMAPLRQSLRGFLMVKAAYERGADAIKISEPHRQQAMANSLQTIKVRLVEFGAAEGEKAVAAPTTQQLAEQFGTYAPIAPGTDQNQFGFGYLYPDRVKVQYIAIPSEAVEKAVRSSRSDYDWEVQEHLYYNRHQSEFPSTQPAAPTTSPLTLGVPEAAVKPAGAATRPFEDVRDQIRSRIVRPEAQKLTEEIASRISSTLAADWAAYTRTRAATGDANGAQAATQPVSSLGVPYDSPEYLPKLALAIQARYGVLPTTSSMQDAPRSAEDLAKMPGIGSAFAGERTFAAYAVGLAEPFLPAAQRERSDALSLWRPSPLLRDAAGNVYFFRLTAAEPAHKPASETEVAAQLQSDLRLVEGYKQAKQAADAFIKVAQTRGMEAAASAVGKPVILTGAFSSRPGATIPNYPVAGPSNAAFVKGAFGLLNEAARANDPHPMQVIELPRDGKVVVAQLQDVTANWSREYAAAVESAVSQQLTSQSRQRFEQAWFDYDGLVNRLKYAPEQTKQPKKEEASAG